MFACERVGGREYSVEGKEVGIERRYFHQLVSRSRKEEERKGGEREIRSKWKRLGYPLR